MIDTFRPILHDAAWPVDMASVDMVVSDHAWEPGIRTRSRAGVGAS